MPQMGISVSEGTILEWRKAVGDPVEADETICDVTTDKVDVEIPCPATGVLARILAEPGETVPVGQPIAEIRHGRHRQRWRDIARESHRMARRSRRATPMRRKATAPASSPPSFAAWRTSTHVDLSQVEGHGVGGRIRKKDLIAHMEHGVRPLDEGPAQAAAPAPHRVAVRAGLAGARGGERRRQARADEPDAKGDRRSHGALDPDGCALHDDRRGRLLGCREAAR